MKNGNITEFIDKLYMGEELLFEYDGQEYFVQGWIEGEKAVMVLDRCSDKDFEDYIWKSECKTMLDCAENFLNAEMWDKKSFLQIQSEVLWKD